MRERPELSIPECLKGLYVECTLTIEQFAGPVHLSKAALDSYKTKDFKHISHDALIKLAKFSDVS